MSTLSPLKTSTSIRRKIGDGKVSQLLNKFQSQQQQQDAPPRPKHESTSPVAPPHSSKTREDLTSIRSSVRVRDTFNYWHRQEEEQIRQEMSSARLIKPQALNRTGSWTARATLTRADSFNVVATSLLSQQQQQQQSSNNTASSVTKQQQQSQEERTNVHTTSPRSSNDSGRRNSVDSNSSLGTDGSTENSSSIHSYNDSHNMNSKDSLTQSTRSKYWYDHLLQSPPPILVNSLLGNPVLDSYDTLYMITAATSSGNDDFADIESVQQQIEEELRQKRHSSAELEDADTFNAFNADSKSNRLNVPVMDLYRVYRDKSVIYNQQYPHYVLSHPFIQYDSVYVNENGSHASLDEMYSTEDYNWDEQQMYEEEEVISDNFPVDEFSQWTSKMQKRLEETITS